jgi:DNA-binding MarR family transcriptional regulator
MGHGGIGPGYSFGVKSSLPALLSWALVAFTIEFDNEAEHRIAHWTSAGRRSGEAKTGVWLVSMAMWSNLMRVLPAEGATVAELRRRACVVSLPLAGMRRWGYIRVEGDASGSGKPPHRPDWVVVPTSRGRRAQEVWAPLAAEVERRWETRFGAETIGALRDSLTALAGQFEAALPAYLPVVGYGLFSEAPPRPQRVALLRAGETVPDGGLAALLAQVLLEFAIEFEDGISPGVGVSMAVAENALRLLDDVGVRVRDLPALAGVSKEGMAMAVGYLERHGFAMVEADPAAARTKRVRLTAKGLLAQEWRRKRLREVESGWDRRFGAEALAALRSAAEKVVSDRMRLFAGLKGYPEGWRTKAGGVKKLPDFPMVLHRGGWPDGS